MRVFSRIVLVAVAAVLLIAPAVLASHLEADCPLQLVATNPPAGAFYQSPHGVFRFGSQVFALRGQTLTTYTVTDLGDMQIVREDFIAALAGRETKGGVAFNAGFLYANFMPALLLFLLWTLVTSIVLLRRSPSTQPVLAYST